MHLDLLRHLVGDLSSDGLSVEVDPGQKATVGKYLRGKGVEGDDSLVGMHIGGRGRKRWQARNFQQLADWITESSGAKVIFVWGPEEKKEIGSFAGRGEDQILSDLFPLPALTALIDRCNLFISPDTGAMHLSVAVDTPTLALFLDSDHVKFGPKGERHRTLVAHNGAISVEAVKEAFDEMVKSVTELST
jgi:ADP-heptose:LPS heptosyltransferase